MKHCANILATMSAFGVLSVVPSASAQLGNLTYTQEELFKPVSYFNAKTLYPTLVDPMPVTYPPGSNTVIVLRGKLIVMASNDSGKPPGFFHVFDVSDPRKPVLLKSYSSALTAKNRELHAMPMAMIDGKFILATPQTTGVAFYDFTDPLNPKDVGSVALNGISGGDYTNVAWELSWSWPYLFVGSSGNGIDVVDATDPAKAVLVKNVPISQTGNFRVGPIHAAGNYLTVTSMDQQSTRVSVLDIGDPRAPFLLTTAGGKSMYSSLTIGDMIFGDGLGSNYSFMKWTPGAITVVAEKKFGNDKGGYCTYQDGYGFCGQSSDGFHKIDLRQYDATNIKEVGRGVPPMAGDYDFATVLGNLVYLGNDHGTGATLIPHQLTPDTTPPKVLKVYPVDQSTKVRASTRITIFFTDEIDTDTVSASSIIVRKAGGAPIAGVFSRSSFNAISFGPRQPLEPNSTYEVVVVANGVKDLAGNAIVEPSVSQFSTGGVVVLGDGGVEGGAGGVDTSGPDGGEEGGAMAGSGGTDVTIGTAGSGQFGGVGGAGSGAGAGGTGNLNGGDNGCTCSLPGRAPSGDDALALLAAAVAMAIGGARTGRRRAAGKNGA